MAKGKDRPAAVPAPSPPTGASPPPLKLAEPSGPVPQEPAPTAVQPAPNLLDRLRSLQSVHHPADPDFVIEPTNIPDGMLMRLGRVDSLVREFSDVIAMDIETIPDPDLIAQFAPALEFRYGNVKDPEKRRQIEEDAAAKATELYALNPHVSRVLSIHLAEITRRPQTEDWAIGCGSLFLSELSDAAEIELLSMALRHMTKWINSRTRRSILLTFNGATFDLPFVNRRCLIHRLNTPFPWTCNRYKVAERPFSTMAKPSHFDIRAFLANTTPGATFAEFRPGNLDYYSRLFFGTGKTDDYPHDRLWELWASDPARFIACGEDDVVRTFGLGVVAIRDASFPGE